VTPLTNGAIDETLQQFAPLSDDCLLQLVDCLESSTLIDHLLKSIPSSAIDWNQVRAVWGPHVRLNERDVLTPQIRVFLAVCDGAPSCRRHPCKMPALLLQDVRVALLSKSSYCPKLLWTITETINTLFLQLSLLVIYYHV